jgi:hypothetical protein
LGLWAKYLRSFTTFPSLPENITWGVVSMHPGKGPSTCGPSYSLSSILLRWYALYLLHVGGRGDLIPCAGYRLITRNLSPHPPPLKFPPSLRLIYSLSRNIK